MSDQRRPRPLLLVKRDRRRDDRRVLRWLAETLESGADVRPIIRKSTADVIRRHLAGDYARAANRPKAPPERDLYVAAHYWLLRDGGGLSHKAAAFRVARAWCAEGCEIAETSVARISQRAALKPIARERAAEWMQRYGDAYTPTAVLDGWCDALALVARQYAPSTAKTR